MFPLNDVAPLKRFAMFVTVEVSHVEMSPYVTVAVVGSLIHNDTAVPMLLSVIGVVVNEHATMEPELSTNIYAVFDPDGTSQQSC